MPPEPDLLDAIRRALAEKTIRAAAQPLELVLWDTPPTGYRATGEWGDFLFIRRADFDAIPAASASYMNVTVTGSLPGLLGIPVFDMNAALAAGAPTSESGIKAFRIYCAVMEHERIDRRKSAP